MKLKTTNENYCATVIKLPVKQKVSGLDNLVSVNVYGNDVLVSKDSDENITYLFFPVECQLSKDFLSNNLLYRDETLNVLKDKKGFFADNGRVKALKLKGVISTGFVIPTSSLNYLGEVELKVGDEFNEINGIEVVRKYVNREQVKIGEKKEKNQRNAADKFDKLVPNQFRFHTDTAQLAKHIDRINLNDVILISRKMHGTSFVSSNILIKKELTWIEKIVNKFIPIVTTYYDNIYSSRKVIKNRYINKNAVHYYDVDIWGVVNQELSGKIEEGISIFGEIVGYLPSGKGIQGKYDYGCWAGKHDFYVYRMTYTKPNGQVIELSWQQIKDYCAKYDIYHVQEYFFGTLIEFLKINSIEREDLLKVLCEQYLEKSCYDCTTPNLPDEGIVLRVDGKEHFNAYKLKSKAFLLGESVELDKGDANIEDEM